MNKMKQYREELNLTQRELAYRLNVDSTRISKIENTGKCSLQIAYCISKILKHSIEEIFFPDEETKK